MENAPRTDTPGVARHLTAIRRNILSRPVRLAFEQGIIVDSSKVFDYGCGHGDDLRNLSERGISCSGWDPVHRPNESMVQADVVNLGYVVNVIEDPVERESTLRAAWSCATSALIVSAQLTDEAIPNPVAALGDGVLTRLNTFQKYFEHAELRNWIEASLGVTTVALGPGVFCVFRDPASEEAYRSRQFRARVHVPTLKRSTSVYHENRELFDNLAEFISARGRLPEASEIPEAMVLAEKCGGLRRAYRILLSLTDAQEWDRIREQRSNDLLVYIALSHFNRVPRWKTIPRELQLDIRAFFRNYPSAKESATKLLFSLGRSGEVDVLCQQSSVGKLTPQALYVHVSALSSMAPALRVFEGCARVIIGAADGANIVKLGRGGHRISYLAYPRFETDPHPRLEWSLSVDLRSFESRIVTYRERENPPILHRKETFLLSSHPLFEKFALLTRQEERRGLLDETSRIGTLKGWQELLNERQLELRGHRVVNAKNIKT